jgi:hypothetical protein
VTDRECVALTGYLLGSAPDGYVKRKYSEAHAIVDGLAPKDAFDAFLLRFALRHPVCTRLADAYVRVFRPGCALRRKLILLLAILESCSPSYRVIDMPVGGSGPLLFIRLALRGAVSVASFVVGSLFLIPARLVIAARRPH